MKKKMKIEGVFEEIKCRQHYQKPSEIKRLAKKQRLINLKKAQKLRRNFL